MSLASKLNAALSILDVVESGSSYLNATVQHHATQANLNRTEDAQDQDIERLQQRIKRTAKAQSIVEAANAANVWDSTKLATEMKRFS